MDARRVVRVFTTRGRLHVRVCGLCGSLVLRDARDQHERLHRSTILQGRD